MKSFPCEIQGPPAEISLNTHPYSSSKAMSTGRLVGEAYAFLLNPANIATTIPALSA